MCNQKPKKTKRQRKALKDYHDNSMVMRSMREGNPQKLSDSLYRGNPAVYHCVSAPGQLDQFVKVKAGVPYVRVG